MKVSIIFGCLTVESENDTEDFALSQWVKHSELINHSDVNKIKEKVTINAGTLALITPILPRKNN